MRNHTWWGCGSSFRLEWELQTAAGTLGPKAQKLRGMQWLTWPSLLVILCRAIFESEEWTFELGQRETWNCSSSFKLRHTWPCWSMFNVQLQPSFNFNHLSLFSHLPPLWRVAIAYRCSEVSDLFQYICESTTHPSASALHQPHISKTMPQHEPTKWLTGVGMGWAWCVLLGEKWGVCVPITRTSLTHLFLLLELCAA